jgi:hypothetical protein
MNTLTRLGVGIALVGGAANSMLYNGNISLHKKNQNFQSKLCS